MPDEPKNTGVPVPEKSTWRSALLKRLLAYPVMILAGLAIVGYLSMERLLFPSPREAAGSGNLTLRSGDFVLDAFYRPAPAGRPVILFSHGNGETLRAVRPFLNEMIGRKYGVMAYDYAGYGASEGRAGEKQSCRDIEAAYNYLVGDRKIPPEQIIIFGFSVGTGPSCHLAGKYPARMLVLAAPFASAVQVKLPFSLPGDRFPNAAILRRTTIPLLVLHGTKDSIIPFRNGKKVFSSSAAKKKLFLALPCDHNDLLDFFSSPEWRLWDRLDEFGRSISEGK
ncbi:MAG: alpha/beta fold hydrolase [Lentisphaeria bacterium]|nr:alpha/beta fold hydrolase [Lentisphaeria bacterium]